MRQVAKSTYGSSDINIWKLHLKYEVSGSYLLKQIPWILGAKHFLNEDDSCICVPLKVLWSVICALLGKTGGALAHL